jgi:hypothetical protein
MSGGHTLNLKQGPGARDRRHPVRVRAGQVFFPRRGARRRRMTVRTVEGEWVGVVLDDGSGRRLALDSLLEVDEEGAGVRYRFQGWKPRPRGYRTELRVARVEPDTALCGLLLPEWDGATEIEELLSTLPRAMRVTGAHGSCMADLASPSAAGLGIHLCRPVGVRGLSRPRLAGHPEVLAEGQRFRRLADGAGFRILDADPASEKVVAWSGRRRVRLARSRLLDRGEDGSGRHYLYLGGGVREARCQRQGPR